MIGRDFGATLRFRSAHLSAPLQQKSHQPHGSTHVTRHFLPSPPTPHTETLLPPSLRYPKKGVPVQPWLAFLPPAWWVTSAAVLGWVWGMPKRWFTVGKSSSIVLYSRSPLWTFMTHYEPAFWMDPGLSWVCFCCQIYSTPKKQWSVIVR